MWEFKKELQKLFSHTVASTPAAKKPLRLARETLLALRHQAKLLATQKPRQVRAAQSGGYLSRFRGRGTEFDEVRPYQPGDDTRDIDWRVSARSGRTYTKLFREERECPLLISLDLRRPMHFGSRVTFKSFQAMQTVALLAWLGEHRGDRIGLSLFNESHHHELRPKRGQKAVLHLINLMLKNQIASNENRECPLEKQLLRLQTISKAGSRLYIVSDFHDLDTAAIQRLRSLARHSEVVCLFIYDPLESQLPSRGHYTVSNGQQRLTLNGNNKLASAFHQQFEQRQQTLQELAQSRVIKLVSIATDEILFDKLRGLAQ